MIRVESRWRWLSMRGLSKAAAHDEISRVAFNSGRTCLLF